MAVQQLLDVGQPAVWERIQLLAARLRQGLAGVPGVAVQDKGRLLCGIVSWTKASPAVSYMVYALAHHPPAGLPLLRVSAAQHEEHPDTLQHAFTVCSRPAQVL